MSSTSDRRVTKVPTVRAPRNADPAELKSVVTSLAEAVEVRLGRRGDPIDRAITLRELIDSGLAIKLRDRPFDPNRPELDFIPLDPIYPTRPPAPTGVTASAAFRTITIFWDQPVYLGHAFAEIWRHDANTLGNATLLGVSTTTAYTDVVEGGLTYYYWVRFVNQSSIFGDFHSTSGVSGTTAPNVDLLLTMLTNAISTSQLTTGLGERIALIDADGTTPGSVNNRILAESIAITNYINTETGLLAAALATESAERHAEVSTAVLSLQAQINDLIAVPAYDPAITYVIGDQVSYNGRLYIAVAQTTGNLPTNTAFWDLLGDFSTLGAVVGQNTAAILQLNTVSSTSTSAAAQALFALQTSVNDGTTGLAATRSQLINNYYTKSQADSAVAGSLTAYVTSVSLNTTLGNYVTNASLTTNYYTKSQTDSAIAGSLTAYVTSVSLNTTLGNYVTNASLTTDYYTKSQADAAVATSLASYVTNTALTTQLASYVTNANLTTSYYTKSQTDSAIAGALTTYVTNASLTTELANYATNANLTTNYYTKSQTDSAIAGSLTTYVTNAALTTALAAYSTTAAISANFFTKSETNSAIAGALTTYVSTAQLNTALGAYTNTAALQANYFTKADGDQALAQYTLKLDVNGRVAGFGLASTSVAFDGGIHSEFAVRADRFQIVSTADNTLIVPFIVTTVTTTLNGVSVPPGVWISDAFIRNGAIANAKIGNLAVDNAKIADLAVNNAKIADAAITNAKIQDAAITNAKIQDAAITTAKIQDLSVDTIKITGNAVSQSAFAVSTTPSPSSLDLVFTSRGGTVMIWGTFFNQGLQPTRTWTLLRNGVTVKTLTASSLPYTLLMFVDTPPAGSVTYRLECTLACNLIEMQILEVLK